jgi:DNA invertase Pin-like site-specific DNA recombinase
VAAAARMGRGLPAHAPGELLGHLLDGAITFGHIRPRGCGPRSLQEPWISTPTPIGEAMLHITIASAEREEQTLSGWTRAGMERARAEGKQLGRPRR